MKSSFGFVAGLLACALPLSASYAQTPSMSVAIKPSSAEEGGRFLVTFRRTGDTSQTSSVRWAVSGAADGADFGRSAAPAGWLRFKVGQAQKGFWLRTIDDAVAEPAETYDIILSWPSNGTIGAGKASATIRDNDAAPPKSPVTLVNLAHSIFWAGEDAFINHILLTGTDYNQWVSSGLLDPVAARFVKMPPGRIRIGPVRGGFVAGAGNFYKGKWILDWEGDGDLSIIGGAGTMTRVSANRIEEDYDPALHGTASPIVRINRIGPAGVSNIRYYRAQHEALLDAGAVFDPRWLADISRFDIIRPMDWTGVNSDYELAASNRPRANRPFYPHGRVPDAVIVRAAVDSGTQLWLNAPGLLGCPQSVKTALRDGSMPLSARVATARDAFDEVMASPEPLYWARQIVSELDAAGYPITRRLFIELDNEVWNTNFEVSTNFYAGIGAEVAARHPGLSGTMRTGYGYRSAQYAAAFAQALAEAGRANQVWTMVLAAHTVVPARTVDALAAVPAFGGPEPMSRYGVATTNYFSGAFRWYHDSTLFGAQLDEAAWRQRWLDELAASPAALSQRITDYFLSPTPMRQNVAYFARNVRANKAAAEAAGARWIGNFEGDSIDTLDPVLASNPAAVALFKQWHESADHGRVINAVADEIRTIDRSAIMANYIFCATRRQPNSPWVECTPWDQSGGDNAAWDGLLKP